MGYWFTHPARGSDAELEYLAAFGRDRFAAALLIRRVAAAVVDRATLNDDLIGAGGGLAYFRAASEAIAYRFVDSSLQIVAVGHVVDTIDEGQLISEALRRVALG
jgi:hypothetical protein